MYLSPHPELELQQPEPGSQAEQEPLLLGLLAALVQLVGPAALVPVGAASPAAPVLLEAASPAAPVADTADIA